MTPKLAIEEFSRRVKAHPDKPYLHQPLDRKLTTYSWSDVDDMARRAAQFLIDLGLKKGDRVGVISKNCAEWFVTDLAIMMAGMISVPVYPTAQRDTISFVLEQSGSKAVFVGKLDDLPEIESGLEASIPRIAFPYPTVKTEHSWDDVMHTEPLKEAHQPVDDETYTISYTSGSTGRPKGVVLSYANIAASSSTTVDLMGVRDTDRVMSYLPLAHITERSLILTVSFYSGCQVFFVESLDTFIDDVKVAKPHLFISVPRLWNKFQIEILNKLPDKKLQFLLKIPVISSLIKKKIKKGLGLQEARLFGSGTAPIAPSILHWYHRLGISISEGWGMTETSALSCSNFPFQLSTLGTIGKPCDCVEMKLDENQEILIRGPAVFKEYYLRPGATQEGFTEGWFHTGDMATITEDGNYQIIGRIKEQFKTSKGKYVAPAPIENLLGHSNDIEQVCVMGHGRKQPIAVVVLNPMLEDGKDVISERLSNTLESVNSQLESHQRLDHIIVLKEEWTIENAMLTPTMKIKRNEIESKFGYYMTKSFDYPVNWE
jgi:long-chain acyl-CoA synthetase